MPANQPTIGQRPPGVSSNIPQHVIDEMLMEDQNQNEIAQQQVNYSYFENETIPGHQPVSAAPEQQPMEQILKKDYPEPEPVQEI